VSGSDTGVTAFANQMVVDHSTLDSAAFVLEQATAISAALSNSTIATAVNAEQDWLQNLKDMLQTTVRPMILMHLQQAQAIQSRIGSPTS